MHTSAAYMSIWWEHTAVETSDKKSIILQTKKIECKEWVNEEWGTKDRAAVIGTRWQVIFSRT
jgi:hypothetical protein